MVISVRCSCSSYPAQSVEVASGDTEVFILKTSPRIRCKQCSTYLFAEIALKLARLKDLSRADPGNQSVDGLIVQRP